jgi:hypothetical protein
MKLTLYVVCETIVWEEEMVRDDGSTYLKTRSRCGGPLMVTSDHLEAKEWNDLIEGPTQITCLEAHVHIGLATS